MLCASSEPSIAEDGEKLGHLPEIGVALVAALALATASCTRHHAPCTCLSTGQRQRVGSETVAIHGDFWVGASSV